MKFWDASAVVPLLVAESTTPAMLSLATTDTEMLVWWATEVECANAVARLERDGALREPVAAKVFDRLRQLALSWHEVEPGDAVREAAVRFLRVHQLRAADALQLAAAFVASEGRPSSLGLITLDDRLASAARREGFTVVGLPSAP